MTPAPERFAVQIDAGKQLFIHSYRPRRRTAGVGRPERLLGGQAMAEAQRLARPRLRTQVFVIQLMALDLVTLLLAGSLALVVVPGMPAPGHLTLLGVWFGAAAVFIATRLAGGYALWRIQMLAPALARQALGLAMGMGATLLVLAAVHEGLMPLAERVAAWAGLAGAVGAGARLLLWLRLRRLTRLGLIEHRVVVVGGGPALAPTLAEIDRCRGEGYRVCGFFDDRMDDRSPAVVGGHHKTGDLSDLISFVRIAQIDYVILAVPDLSRGRLLELLATLSALPVEVRMIDTARAALPERARRSRIGKLGLVELCRPPLTRAQAAQKRAFDILAASAALVLFAPVMLVVALAVRLDSPGPVLFRQKRHGFNNRPVEVLKFRSMHADRCDPTAVRAVRQQDDRVTRVGRLIRRCSLDELPQLFNVLAGTLSMVGPRPHATAARTGDIWYDEVAEAYSARHKVKPGITGWAQVNGWRGELNTAEKIRARIQHDLFYIENWSLWFDIRILLMTPRALLSSKNAY